MRRSFVLLAGAAVVAGGAALLADDRGPEARIDGPALAPTSVVAAAGSAVDLAEPTSAAPGATPPPTPRVLAGTIDLDQITRVGDHYEAPLADGRRAVLTLDVELQPLAERLLDQSRAPRGGIVVMAPDGRILALAGRRTDDPAGGREGTFDWRVAADVWAPAASIFKLVTATALVEAGVGADDRVCYHGGVRSVMESNLTDSKRDSRCESLRYGVAHSNNAILGKLAFQHLEPAQLDRAAQQLGFVGALPGDQLPGTAGRVAIPTVKDLAYARTAAGFANTELSAVGGALLATTFATGGLQPVPRLIASIGGTPATTTAPRRRISTEVAHEVARMMTSTCESGSAAKVFRKRKTTSAAGKTGTLSRKEPFYMEHSWFVGFAPAEQPEVIVSVLLGNPESWHLRGHEAAKRLIDQALRANQRDKDRTASTGRTGRNQW